MGKQFKMCQCMSCVKEQVCVSLLCIVLESVYRGLFGDVLIHAAN